MPHSPKIIGLIQAIGLVLYVALFAMAAPVVVEGVLEKYENPTLFIISFLLAFVFSALVCGSITLGYPAILVLEGKRKSAIEVVFWNAAWLLIFGLLLIVGLALGRTQ